MNRLIRATIALAMAAGSLAGLTVAPAAAADAGAMTTLAPLNVTVGSPVAVGGTRTAGFPAGAGWNPGEAVTIWLAGSNGQKDWTTPIDPGSIMATAVADLSGNWGTSFIMPDRRTGLLEIYVQGATNTALFTARGTTPAAGTYTGSNLVGGVPPGGEHGAGVVRTMFPASNTWGPRADTAVNTINVIPYIDRSPSSGPPGAMVTVRGSGFGRLETGIAINFSGGGGLVNNTVASGITATTSGAWTATFNVPDGPPGTYNIDVNVGKTLVVTGNGVEGVTPGLPLPTVGAPATRTGSVVTTQAITGLRSFILTTGLRITPTTGPMGTIISFSGGGIPTPGGNVTVGLNVGYGAVPLELIPSTIAVGATGLIAGQAKIPGEGLPEGPAELIISVNGVPVASATFTISVSAAFISLDPAAGGPGVRVTVAGGGFEPNSPLTIKFDNEVRTIIPSGLTTSSAGSFKGSITVPARANGVYAVLVTDAIGEPASAPFTVNNATASLNLSPNSGLGTVIVAGRGFTPGSPVNLYVDGNRAATFPETPQTTNPPVGVAATFTAMIGVPALTAGQYEIAAVDIYGFTGRATFTVPALPGLGQEGPLGIETPVLDGGARFAVTVLDAALNPVPNAIVNLVRSDTGLSVRTGATNAVGLLVMTAPYVSSRTWYRVDASAGTVITPRRLLVLEAPPAEFLGMPVAGSAPLTVNFFDQSLNSPTAWSWSFGDGTGSSSQNPTKVYSQGGSYTVSLTATGSGGSDTRTKAGYIQVIEARFSAFPLSGSPPFMVNFADESRGVVTGWWWDFGDGTASSSQNPSHLYASSGNYTVSLTVTGPGGGSTQTRTAYISTTGVQHIPAFGQTQGADGLAYLDIRVSRIRNPSTNADVPAPGGIGGYEFNLAFPPATGGNGVNIMAVRGVGPFDSPAHGNLPSTGGFLTVAGILPEAAIQDGASPQSPLTLAQVSPRILGSASVSHDLVLTFNSLLDGAGGNNIPADGTRTLTLRRGNARNDGAVDMADALFIAQFRVGMRFAGDDISSTHIINGASVKLETTSTGEKLDMNDALFVAQYRVGLRNASFDWIA